MAVQYSFPYFINHLYLTRVTLNSRVTDKPVALEFQVELEFICFREN